MFGKLTWSAIPFDQPIPLAAGGIVILVVIAVIGWTVAKGHFHYVWKEWITASTTSGSG